ncbi:MAG: SagB/ThcOx family dehydrogenase [Candidatus Sumerlaeia bacterium]|nr:SagB/ThcOx family dehydrogenase [Candidatus Sumerlaeia bacterium]
MRGAIAVKWKGRVFPRISRFALVLAAGILLAADAPQAPKKTRQRERVASNLQLPPPVLSGKMSVEEALSKRRSVRRFIRRELGLAQVGQLMWAAQGINRTSEGERKLRTVPSAGQTYPLEVYLASQDGLFHYLPREHQLEWLDRTDLRGALAEAAAQQEFIREAPAVIILTAVPARTSARYGEQAPRYIFLEAGHAAQNVQLQSTALEMGSVCVAGFFEEAVSEALKLPGDEIPLYLIPVGWPDALQPTPTYAEPLSSTVDAQLPGPTGTTGAPAPAK